MSYPTSTFILITYR